MIQVQTDNRNRTVGEVRAVLTRAGGTLGENGSVGWMFDQMGLIEVPIGSADPDEIALVAIDAGASDVETEDGVLVVYTDPTELHRTREALISAGYEVEAAQLTMRPKTLVAPEPDAAVKLIRLVEKAGRPRRRARGLHQRRCRRRGPGRGHVARPEASMIAIGFDPGTARLGYGVIESEPDPQAIDFGVIVTDAREPMAQRLLDSLRGWRIDRSPSTRTP